ncbi:hypothetical protein DL1_17655 [Thioclava dalianensis]|uniref:Tryptophan--tRNA ligase n=1 Tax=Thioclava dalianensis TaxID=1185766 RepID=A0A074TJX6_9RHOB|nr:hypothetical protein [Thioclava dalianensis]KEP70480.1 hypothetical protein DL1_17655 [Thioclava dalianensis]
MFSSFLRARLELQDSHETYLLLADLLPEAQAIIPRAGRLPGVDGKAKMSKSGGNAIPLSATPDQISAAVRAMVTDPAQRLLRTRA